MTRISVGGVWDEMLAVAGRHFGVFATLMAAFAFLPTLTVGLAFPEILSMKPGTFGTPPELPPGFGLTIVVLAVLQFVGLFGIIAIAADPAEGGGKSVGETMRDALPAIGKFLLALLVVWVGLLVLVLVIALAGGLLLGISGSGSDQSHAMTLAIGIAGFVIAVAVWIGARLTALPGVLLREGIGPVDSLKRALALSQGATGTLLLLTLIYFLASVIAVLLAQGLAAAFGLVGTVAGNTRIGTTIAQVASAGFGAWLSIYYGTALGVVYRQLANR
jgi:hypothetical protein